MRLVVKADGCKGKKGIMSRKKLPYGDRAASRND